MEPEELDRIAEAMTTRIDEKFAEMAEAQKANQDPEPKKEKPVVKEPVSGEPLTAETMKDTLSSWMKDNQVSEATKVYNTMFAERVATTKQRVPGFEAYLEEEDDYGKVRKDALDKLESYEDKVATLDRWSNKFAEALSNTPSRQHVDPKVRKKVDKAEKKYSEVEDKWDTGGYTNIADFTHDYLDAMSAELAAIR